jgi:predicted AAA+ superfamily ATPase
MKYIRLMEYYLKNLLEIFPAIAVDGLKSIGKTVTSKELSKTIFELDTKKDLIKFRNQINDLQKMKKPILIDEWQRYPESWDKVRRLVDDETPSGSFLLTGSLTDENIDVHSGSGRIIRKKMFPLSFEERGLVKKTVSLGKILNSKKYSYKMSGQTNINFEKYIDEILISGLPAFRKYKFPAINNMFESYFYNILSHEFKQQGLNLRQPETLYRWLKGYSAAIATDASYNEILDASTSGEGNKPAAKTTIAYREALTNLFLIEELMPWADGENYFSTLKKVPKHYLAEPAFAAYLLELSKETILGNGEFNENQRRFDDKYGNILGRLFEALVKQSLNTYTSVNEAKLFYFATNNPKHEIDFIVKKQDKLVAIEVKMVPDIDENDVKELKWFKEKMGHKFSEAIVLTTGDFAYRREDGIAVIPFALFGA